MAKSSNMKIGRKVSTPVTDPDLRSDNIKCAVGQSLLIVFVSWTFVASQSHSCSQQGRVGIGFINYNTSISDAML